MHDGSCVFSVRAAGAAFHFGKAVCPPVGLSIGGIGLAPQDGALFGLQVSMGCQISNVLGFGAPLTHGIGRVDSRDMLLRLFSKEFPIEVVGWKRGNGGARCGRRALAAVG